MIPEELPMESIILVVGIQGKVNYERGNLDRRSRK